MCSTMSLVVRWCLICKLDEIKKLPAYTTILLQFSQGKAAKASAQGKKKKRRKLPTTNLIVGELGKRLELQGTTTATPFLLLKNKVCFMKKDYD